ncbi:type I toxin-antitoxin system antitoxin YafN [Marinospirillum insulare]|uniref:Antitoxin YafN n=1 Tax=Marinospirillum insulare TaxID=217169 RepID=A0ABQ5ZUB4_9GAMM|nr:type I toxin-antitoxin system antitoxin YafN [Marinospirillum insulare]GLR62637.1 antitoxin YafN [Marinospirillum insulare]
MKTNLILAEKSVSISALRSNPAQYFVNEPVAVLNHNKPAGYLVGAALFEEMVNRLSVLEESQAFIGRFQPRGAELAELCKKGADLMLETTQEEMADFAE